MTQRQGSVGVAVNWRRLAAVLVLVGALPVAGRAQSNPSSDDIIRSLRPGAGALSGPTRGIRMLPGSSPAAPSSTAPASTAGAHHAPAATAAAAAVTAVPATTAGGAPAIDISVNFPSGSSELTPSAMHSLDNLGRALASPDLAAYHFRIEGHTDTVGSPESNRALSERRAQAVAAYIAHRYKVDTGRLQPVGVGEDNLLVATPPNTPEPRNRRVQVINVGA